MKNIEVLAEEQALGIGNGEARMKNKIRGCECAPEYKVAQKWNDGRMKLSVGCGVHPNIMLDPNGTFRVKLYEDLSGLPKELREEILQERKDIKKKEDRKGCELLWNGKTYTFNGYY